MAGIYLGKKKTGELTLGGYNTDRINAINYFTAYNYNGMWELSVNTLGYAGASTHLYARRGLLMLHMPFLIIPLKDFQPIMNKISEQRNGKCYRDATTYSFWCEVTSTDVNQFAPLELALTPTQVYYISPDKYVDIVRYLPLKGLDTRRWSLEGRLQNPSA